MYKCYMFGLDFFHLFVLVKMEMKFFWTTSKFLHVFIEINNFYFQGIISSLGRFSTRLGRLLKGRLTFQVWLNDCLHASLLKAKEKTSSNQDLGAVLSFFNVLNNYIFMWHIMYSVHKIIFKFFECHCPFKLLLWPGENVHYITWI